MATYRLPDLGGLHKTLTSTTADTVTVNVGNVEVKNRMSSANPIYVRVDGSVAVSAADGTTIIEPGEYVVFSLPNNVGALSIVGNGDSYSVDRA